MEIERHRLGPFGDREWYLRSSSRDSPRVNGELQYQQNPFYRIEAVALYTDHTGPCDVPNTGAMPLVQSRSLGALKLYHRAYKRLESEARSNAQAAIAVDLAEGRKTLDMVTSAVGTLYKGARYIRRGNFIEAARTFRIAKPRGLSNRTEDFLNNWLAYRYGWLPAVNSVYNTIEAYKAPPKNRRFRVSTRDSQASTGVRLEDRLTFRGFMEVESPALARLGQLGLLNPAQVAWELVPGSFILDWFLPIGDYLDTFDDFVGIKFNDFSLTWTSFAEVEQYYAQPDNPFQPMGWYAGVPPLTGAANRNPYSNDGMAPYFSSHTKTRAKQKSRVLLSTPPKPIFNPIENGLNPKRLLDALALLTGLFKPFKRTGIQ